MLAGPPTTVLGGWRARRRQLRIIVLSALLFFARVVVLRSAPYTAPARAAVIISNSQCSGLGFCGADPGFVCSFVIVSPKSCVVMYTVVSESSLCTAAFSLISHTNFAQHTVLFSFISFQYNCTAFINLNHFRQKQRSRSTPLYICVECTALPWRQSHI